MSDYNPRFSNKKPFQKRGFDRGAPKQMHKADCAKCGSMTEVPFRPNGRKPVYCSNCFVKDDAAPQRSFSSGPRREFSPRPSFNSAPRDDRSMQDVKRELEGVNAKLERLISLMTPAAVAAPAPAKKAVKKVVKKKAAKKK